MFTRRMGEFHTVVTRRERESNVSTRLEVRIGIGGNGRHALRDGIAGGMWLVAPGMGLRLVCAELGLLRLLLAELRMVFLPSIPSLVLGRMRLLGELLL